MLHGIIVTVWEALHAGDNFLTPSHINERRWIK